MLNRILGVRNERRRNVRHDFASTSNSQQNSGLSNNETPGPSNVNANIQSTSSHSSSQNRDTFNNTVGGRNDGNLEMGDTSHGLNRIFGSFNPFSTSRSQKPISLSQMEHALNIWENNITQYNIIFREDKCTAKERILECFQKRDTLLDLGSLNLKSLPEEIGNLTWLSHLSLYDNQLTALPDSFGNLTGLSELLLSNNRLSALPDSFGNLTRLSHLSLYDNQLSALPDFFGNLTKLSELALSNNQLSALPDSFGNLTKLIGLNLSNNQLSALPDSFGNFTKLRFLHLSNNQLTALPNSFGNLTGLSELDLDNNQLTALPPGIFRLPQETEVNLEQNPLSQQTIAALTQRTGGPQISFSIVETPAAQVPRSRGRSFENAIRHYCSNISPEYLRILQGTENAAYFGQLLNRLDGTTGPMASADASLPGFADRVAAVIRTLAEVDSAELRANCYLQAQHGLETCSDRVAITFSDIEVACKSHRILQVGGGYAQMVPLLRGMFRLNTLDAFARRDIATRQGVDDIEVLLAYRVGLKNELELPCETSAMNHNAFSGVAQAELDRAKAHVLAAESTNDSAALVNFAIEQPFWNTYIEKNQRFQKQKQDIEMVFQMVGEELEERAQTMPGNEYMQEYNTLAANRVAMLRDMQREYTSEILHRF